MSTPLIRSLNRYKNHAYDWLAQWVGGCVLCARPTGQKSTPAISPRLCAVCAHQISHSCLEAEPMHRCQQCAHLLSTADALCGDCLNHPPTFTHSTAFADYAGSLQNALLQFKFHQSLHLASLLAECLRHAARHYAQSHRPDLIVLVPQLSERLSERGFHPLRLVVQHIDWAHIWPEQTPIYQPDALLRVHHAQLQIHVKPDLRRKQVKNAFALNALCKAHHVRDRHILVIDDIMTTGATLNEIARLLQKAGAKRVDNLLIARTPKAANK